MRGPRSRDKSTPSGRETDHLAPRPLSTPFYFVSKRDPERGRRYCTWLRDDTRGRRGAIIYISNTPPALFPRPPLVPSLKCLVNRSPLTDIIVAGIDRRARRRRPLLSILLRSPVPRRRRWVVCVRARCENGFGRPVARSMPVKMSQGSERLCYRTRKIMSVDDRGVVNNSFKKPSDTVIG